MSAQKTKEEQRSADQGKEHSDWSSQKLIPTSVAYFVIKYFNSLIGWDVWITHSDDYMWLIAYPFLIALTFLQH